MRFDGYDRLTAQELKHLAAAWDPRLPEKVRKILLLQAVDLPLNETFIFEKQILSSKDVSRVIRTGEHFLSQGRRVVVRTAWIPMLLNAPWFRANDISSLMSSLDSLRDPEFERSAGAHRFTHIVLHADTAHPADVSERYTYLAGRFLLHPEIDLPFERSLEIVWAEYFAKVLDVGGFDFSDERFAGYRIEAGQMSWRSFKESPTISLESVRRLVHRFKEIESRAQCLREALAFIHGVRPGNIALVLEFQATVVPPWLFHIYGFDYAFSR